MAFEEEFEGEISDEEAEDHDGRRSCSLHQQPHAFLVSCYRHINERTAA